MNTIATQLTGRGVGAIAVLLLAGPEAPAILSRLAATDRAKSLHPGQSAHSEILHPQTRASLDDAMIICTADNTYELHVHGGIAVVDTLLNALAIAGAILFSPDDPESTNIFGPGIEAEIRTTLPRAQTMTGARLVAAQSTEGLAAWVTRWHAWLEGKSPNDLWRLHSATQWLLARSATLTQLLHPPRIAILGPPNAGKSTLANALLGRPISITSDIAGTTRDWVDAHATFTTLSHDTDVPVILVDTAGIRTTTDPLEQQSIARSHHQAGIADLILFVLDASQPPSPADLSFISAYDPQRLVVIANKTDAGHLGVGSIKRQWPRTLEVSAMQRTGTDQLMQQSLELLDLETVACTEPFAFTSRQCELLEKIALTNEPRRAADLMEEIQKTPTKTHMVG